MKILFFIFFAFNNLLFAQINISQEEKNIICNGGDGEPHPYRYPTNPPSLSFAFNFGQAVAWQSPDYGRGVRNTNYLSAAGAGMPVTEFNTIYPNSALERIQKRVMNYCFEVLRNYPATYRTAEQLLTHLASKCADLCGRDAGVCEKACHLSSAQTNAMIQGMRFGRDNCLKNNGNYKFFEQLQNCESMKEQDSLRVNQGNRGIENYLFPLQYLEPVVAPYESSTR